MGLPALRIRSLRYDGYPPTDADPKDGVLRCGIRMEFTAVSYRMRSLSRMVSMEGDGRVRVVDVPLLLVLLLFEFLYGVWLCAR